MRRDDVLSHPSHRATEGDDEIRFWLPAFDRNGRQERRPWWDRRVFHEAMIDGQTVGFWEWKSGVRDRIAAIDREETP